MKRAQTLEVALVSNNTAAFENLGWMLNAEGLALLRYSTALAAEQALRQRAFDAVVLDLAATGVCFLEALRKSTLNKNTVALALAADATARRQAIHSGADLVLEGPTGAAEIAEKLCSNRKLMTWQRRRYPRTIVPAPCRIRLNSCVELRGHLLDLSKRGVSLSAPVVFQIEDLVVIGFSLADQAFCLSGRTVWADDAGHAGIEFTEVPERTSQRLQTCLKEICSDQVPKLAEALKNDRQALLESVL